MSYKALWLNTCLKPENNFDIVGMIHEIVVSANIVQIAPGFKIDQAYFIGERSMAMLERGSDCAARCWA